MFSSLEQGHCSYLELWLLLNHFCCLCPEWPPVPRSLPAGYGCWGPPLSSPWTPIQGPLRCCGACPLQMHLFHDFFSMVSARCEQCSAVPGHSSGRGAGRKTRKWKALHADRAYAVLSSRVCKSSVKATSVQCLQHWWHWVESRVCLIDLETLCQWGHRT